MIDFRTQKSCMRCQILVRYPFKFYIFVSGGVGQFGNIYVFVFVYHHCSAYDFHFSKLFEKFFVHALSMIPHAHVHAV
jgi:hypothetical protein